MKKSKPENCKCCGDKMPDRLLLNAQYCGHSCQQQYNANKFKARSNIKGSKVFVEWLMENSEGYIFFAESLVDDLERFERETMADFID